MYSAIPGSDIDNVACDDYRFFGAGNIESDDFGWLAFLRYV